MSHQCQNTELLRDYLFEELIDAERRNLDVHLAGCLSCTAELDRLRVTTAALKAVPDVELPRHIAFLPVRQVPAGRLAGFWNSAARLAFASACIIGVALVASRSPGQPDVRPEIQAQTADIAQQVNAAVAKAVAQVREEDARATQAAVHEVDAKYQQERREVMVRVTESLEFYKKRSSVRLAMADYPGVNR